MPPDPRRTHHAPRRSRPDLLRMRRVPPGTRPAPRAGPTRHLSLGDGALGVGPRHPGAPGRDISLWSGVLGTGSSPLIEAVPVGAGTVLTERLERHKIGPVPGGATKTAGTAWP